VDIEVADSPAESRYEVLVDGELAGFAMYRTEDGNRVFFHTEVDPAYEGQGLGSRLVVKALGDMREQGVPVVPLCPFFARYIRRHPEWDDVLAPAIRERFEKVRARA
jgi:predicted GNAT family acetyltransferase